ncbi:protein of unknown function [Rhodovastum atsumiense]|nr:protein of unknown function [Rhodovastum atsumiense]
MSRLPLAAYIYFEVPFLRNFVRAGNANFIISAKGQSDS